MKNGCKDFTSPTMDKIEIEPFYENRLHDINFALVKLGILNHRRSYLMETMDLARELYRYIIYLYSHIDQLEKDKRYLLKQKLTLYKANNKQVGKRVVKNEKYNNYRCPCCNAVIYTSQHYCSQCGQKFDWRI